MNVDYNNVKINRRLLLGESEIGIKKLNCNVYLDQENLQKCLLCALVEPSVECSDCFQLLCQGCLNKYGHDPSHKLNFFVRLAKKPSSNSGNSSLDDPNQILNLTGVPQNPKYVKNVDSYIFNNKELPDESYKFLKKNQTNDYENLNFYFKYKFKTLPHNSTTCEDDQLTKICKTCNYLPITNNDSIHKKKGHVIISLQQSYDELCNMLKSLDEASDNIMNRNNDAQHRSIKVYNNTKLSLKFLNEQINAIYNNIMNAMNQKKTAIIEVLNKTFDYLADELEVIDIVLYEQKLKFDACDKMLVEITKLAVQDKAGAINAWRAYCSDIENIENTEIQTKKLIISYLQCNSYLENFDQYLTEFRDIFRTTEYENVMLIQNFSENFKLEPSKVSVKVRNDEILELETLHEFLNMQKLLNLPIKSGNKTNFYTTPYTTNFNTPILANYFYRIDTFHLKWEKVYVCIYENYWLAIYTNSDPNKIIYNSTADIIRGFKENTPYIDEFGEFHDPPENILPIPELKINLLNENKTDIDVEPNNNKSPVAKFTEKTLKLPAFEIIRYFNGKAIGYWILANQNKQEILDWIETLQKLVSSDKYPDKLWPEASSNYIPSTNPGILTKNLNIDLPPTNQNWAAFHIREAETTNPNNNQNNRDTDSEYTSNYLSSEQSEGDSTYSQSLSNSNDETSGIE